MLFLMLYIRYLRRTDVFIVNFEHISHLVVVLLSLNLNINWWLANEQYTLFFIRTSKFCLGLAALNFFSFLKLKCS